jgi:hypothetical protein
MDTIRFRGKDKFGTWRYGFLLQDRSGYSALVPIQYPLLQWKINLENELKFVYKNSNKNDESKFKDVISIMMCNNNIIYFKFSIIFK